MLKYVLLNFGVNIFLNYYWYNNCMIITYLARFLSSSSTGVLKVTSSLKDDMFIGEPIYILSFSALFSLVPLKCCEPLLSLWKISHHYDSWWSTMICIICMPNQIWYSKSDLLSEFLHWKESLIAVCSKFLQFLSFVCFTKSATLVLLSFKPPQLQI